MKAIYKRAFVVKQKQFVEWDLKWNNIFFWQQELQNALQKNVHLKPSNII